MSQQIIKLANQYLDMLVLQSIFPWTDATKKAYGDKAPSVEDSVRKQFTKLGFSTLNDNFPLAFIGGVSSLRELVPEVLPSQEKIIIDSLKLNKRIVQIGPGSGRIILLPVGYMPLTPDIKIFEETVSIQDEKGLIKSLSNLLNDLEVLRHQHANQKQLITELEAKIENLQRLQNINILTTWS